MKPEISSYNNLLTNIGSVIESGKKNALSAINQHLLFTYWQVGKYIVDFEQHGSQRAVYGSALVSNLSRDLKLKFGRGFSLSNLKVMRLFYLKYPENYPSEGLEKSQTSGLSQKSQTSGFSIKYWNLTWSHYNELLSVTDDLERSFYELQSIKENWSVRELNRQISSSLFQRIALSKDKEGVLNLAKKGHHIKSSADLVRDPYVFEFLNIKQNNRVTEKGLEKKLIDNLQSFLLELGKGFSFVARQFKLTLDNQHYYIDLVFYHRILKCFVLIDLKINKVKHQDIGQMNLYLNYFKEEENTEGDNDPIGIIIASDKQELLVKYATGGLSNKIFVSKYQLYLPNKKELEDKVKEIIESN